MPRRPGGGIGEMCPIGRVSPGYVPPVREPVSHRQNFGTLSPLLSTLCSSLCLPSHPFNATTPRYVRSLHLSGVSRMPHDNLSQSWHVLSARLFPPQTWAISGVKAESICGRMWPNVSPFHSHFSVPAGNLRPCPDAPKMIPINWNCDDLARRLYCLSIPPSNPGSPTAARRTDLGGGSSARNIGETRQRDSASP